jgi:hypothetical protein
MTTFRASHGQRKTSQLRSRAWPGTFGESGRGGLDIGRGQV